MLTINLCYTHVHFYHLHVICVLVENLIIDRIHNHKLMKTGIINYKY